MYFLRSARYSSVGPESVRESGVPLSSDGGVAGRSIWTMPECLMNAEPLSAAVQVHPSAGLIGNDHPIPRLHDPSRDVPSPVSQRRRPGPSRLRPVLHNSAAATRAAVPVLRGPCLRSGLHFPVGGGPPCLAQHSAAAHLAFPVLRGPRLRPPLPIRIGRRAGRWQLAPWPHAAEPRPSLRPCPCAVAPRRRAPLRAPQTPRRHAATPRPSPVARICICSTPTSLWLICHFSCWLPS